MGSNVFHKNVEAAIQLIDEDDYDIEDAIDSVIDDDIWDDDKLWILNTYGNLTELWESKVYWKALEIYRDALREAITDIREINKY